MIERARINVRPPLIEIVLKRLFYGSFRYRSDYSAVPFIDFLSFCER